MWYRTFIHSSRLYSIVFFGALHHTQLHLSNAGCSRQDRVHPTLQAGVRGGGTPTMRGTRAATRPITISPKTDLFKNPLCTVTVLRK